jgi:hypothetical protein
MSSCFVRKIAPVVDALAGPFPGVFISDYNNNAHAVQQYGALAGRSVASGDKFAIIPIEPISYVGVSASLSYPSIEGPATPANGE